jgi:hypothetical protein
MWLAIAAVFLIAWLIAFLAFHIAVAAIHILLGLFVVFLIVHFVRRAAQHAWNPARHWPKLPADNPAPLQPS